MSRSLVYGFVVLVALGACELVAARATAAPKKTWRCPCPSNMCGGPPCRGCCEPFCFVGGELPACKHERR